MSGSLIQPERAWNMALDQLRLDMPKAAFDTWVNNTSFVAFEDGVFTIGTPSAYGREWLASRLTSTVTRLMTGILNQQVEVQFVVTEEVHESEEDDRSSLIQLRSPWGQLPGCGWLLSDESEWLITKRYPAKKGGEDAMRFLRDQQAIETSEVAVIIAVVVLVAYGAYQLLGALIAEVVRDVPGRL